MFSMQSLDKNKKRDVNKRFDEFFFPSPSYVIDDKWIWVISSVGRAPRLHRDCQRFESVIAQKKIFKSVTIDYEKLLNIFGGIA